LLVLAILLSGGIILGFLSKKIGLPGVTGQIVAGVLIGKSGFHLIDVEALDIGLRSVTEFALCLIAVTIGSHLNLKRFHNAYRRIVIIVLLEVLLVPLCVAAGLRLSGTDPISILMLSVIAIATAPATTIAIINETKSRGVFVKTLLAVVALNNIVCIVLFEIARSFATGWLAGTPSLSPWDILIQPLFILGGNAAVGCFVGLLLVLLTKYLSTHVRQLTATLSAIFIVSGIASELSLSPLLSALFMGCFVANITSGRDKILGVARELEETILILFFVIAGVHLDLSIIGFAGPVCLVYTVTRIIGKYGTIRISGLLSSVPGTIKKWLGLALIPQAGVAIGLVILIEEDPAFYQISDFITTVVLAGVLINEIIGPIATRFALKKSGEFNQDRSRLIDFFQEENILMDISGQTKQEVIHRLSHFFASTQQINGLDGEKLHQMFMERENQYSTCMGQGIMIPHIIIPEGKQIVGVVGISSKGLNLDTPDRKPVHIIIMMATPKVRSKYHLEALSAISRIFGRNTQIEDNIVRADNPAKVVEILCSKKYEDLNYFFEN